MHPFSSSIDWKSFSVARLMTSHAKYSTCENLAKHLLTQIWFSKTSTQACHAYVRAQNSKTSTEQQNLDSNMPGLCAGLNSKTSTQTCRACAWDLVSVDLLLSSRGIAKYFKMIDSGTSEAFTALEDEPYRLWIEEEEDASLTCWQNRHAIGEV